jgi:hypothetical protein
MKKRMIELGLAILFALLVLQGCSSENGTVAPVENEPPALPPLSSMKMDISFFDGAGVPDEAVRAGTFAAAPGALAAGVSRLNFLNAAVRVLYLDVVVYSALVDPVAAFALAVNSVPQRQPDGSWLWTYIVKEGAIEYGIFLYGLDLGDVVSWRMEVSSNDPRQPFDHFVWFDGEVERCGCSGYWQFYAPVEAVATAIGAAAFGTSGEQLIRIDWSHTGRMHQLILTVDRPGDPAEGSTLAFYESAEYCSIEFFDAEKGTNGVIRWNADGTGYIEWPDYNGGERGCWDGAQRDVDCAL